MRDSCRVLSHPTVAGQLSVDRPAAASTWSVVESTQVPVMWEQRWRGGVGHRP